MIRNKTPTYQHLLLQFSLLSQSQIHSKILYSFPHSNAGDGNGSCGELITPCPCSLQPLFTSSSIRSLPQGQSNTFFSNVSPSLGLQFFMNCSSVGPLHGVRLFWNRLLQTVIFSPVKYIIPEFVPPLLGFGLVSSRIILELAGTGSAGYSRSFQKYLTETTPAPSATKTWPQKPNTLLKVSL